ncbi:MAG: ChbG/HpnK family deacetylase [Ramlibacter sp.]|nr:ChbG/HpnK family deacetylase [Ramlibacter sp.]
MVHSTASGRTLAICVDDFGLHDGVNRAVLALADQGRISATSCMVGAPQWAAGAAALRRLAPGTMDLGLHLDLTENPLEPRLRRPLHRLISLSLARCLDRAALAAEIDRQLDCFEQHLGRAPDHVDGHQHVHQLPVVRELLCDALVRRYAGRLPWLRSTRRPQHVRPREFKPWLIEQLGCAALSRLAAAHGFRQNSHLVGVYDFQGDAAGYRARLGRWLEQAGDGDLLMCHAALDGPPAESIGAARSNEFEVLAGAGFAELLARSGLRVATPGRTEVLGRTVQAASL